MNKFYIEKLVITGQGKTTSSVTFSKGLNIICGPSNTGKTYIVKCINFLFGAEKSPIDSSTGYDTISLFVETSKGTVVFSRKIDSKKINVKSINPDIESGEYEAKMQSKKYDKSISSVWLKLIGISDKVLIIASEKCKKQTLSWRTFVHMFLLDEHRIISEDSILLPLSPTGNTAAISSLLYLITGNDYDELTIQEDAKIKEVKKKAVISYINSELSALAERNSLLLEQLSNVEGVDYEKEIENILEEIAKIEEEIAQDSEKSENIFLKLAENNQQLAECNVLLNRYNELKTQYLADMKRLSFILDGAINKNTSQVTKCPFCDSKMHNMKNETDNYIEASKAEYKKLELQLKDLSKAIKQLEDEQIYFSNQSVILEKEQRRIEELINVQLQPQVQLLKEKITEYRHFVEIEKEMRLIKELCKNKGEDLVTIETDTEKENKFKVKDHLERAILDRIDEKLYDFLKDCHYKDLLTVRFSREKMDLVVNGKDKHTFGKGYCAFFNTVVAMVFAEYIKEKGKFSPSMLILDSPILSLKEAETKVSESMKSALFSKFIDNPNDLQIILIENEVPNIEYKESNIIRFTKNPEEGRYGLLYDVEN